MAGVQFREPIDLNKLEIRNAALQNLASDPATPVDGQIWQRTDIDKTKISTGAKVETVRYVSDHLFDASTASGNGPIVINTDGAGTDTALSIGATGINSPRLLIDVATQTPKLQAYTVAASTSMEPTLIQALDSNSKTAITADSVKVQRTDITENMELTTSDLLQNGQSVISAHPITSGVISVPGPEWTLKTAPNVITMASCSARLYDNANWIGLPKTYTIPAKDFTLVDGQDAMVIAHYNSGTPEYRIVDAWNFTAYNLSDTCLVYRFWYQFGTIHSASLDSIGNGLCEKQALRLGQTTYYARTGNVGLDLGETATPVARTVTITAANVWSGPLPIDVASFNSSTDTMGLIVKNVGVWTRTSATVWPNDSYNDNAGLITMTTNRYGVVWVYRSVGDAKEVFLVLGKAQYTSATDAASEAPRTDLPFMLYSHCMLVGRFIFQKSATAATVIQSAFTQAFGSVPSSSIAASSVTFTPVGDIASTDVQAAIAELDAEKAPKQTWTWTRGSITSSPGWAKIISLTLPDSTTTNCNWFFNVIRIGSSAGTNSRIGKLRIQWRNGALSAEFTRLAGSDSGNFGYTGTLAPNSLFEVYAYCTAYPYLMLEIEHNYGGVIAGGTFSTTDPGKTDIYTDNIATRDWAEEKHDRTDIGSGTDWNTLISPGTYRNTGTLGSNAPTGAYGYGILEVLAKDFDSQRCAQVYYPHRGSGTSNGGIWLRVSYDASSGSWQGWQRIANKDYLDTVYASKNANVERWTSNVGGEVNLNYDVLIWTYSGAVGLSMALGNGSFDGQRMEIFNCNANSSAGSIVLSGTITGPTSVPRYTSLRLVWVASTSRWYSAA